jgi:hypothetical protein
VIIPVVILLIYRGFFGGYSGAIPMVIPVVVTGKLGWFKDGFGCLYMIRAKKVGMLCFVNEVLALGTVVVFGVQNFQYTTKADAS